jgi:hypothetical protein
MAQDAKATEAVSLLIGAAKIDTIYRDIYLRRARELLSDTLDESGYHAIGSANKEIDELVGRTRSAVSQHKWEEAAKLSAQADQLRQSIAATGNVGAIAKDVYEADTVAFDPFSPGKHLGPQSQANQPDLRGQVIDILTSLSKLDTSLGAFYEKRRGYFSGLEFASAATSQKSSKQNRAELEQRAVEAAERGDLTAVQALAKELQDYKGDDNEISAGAATVKNRYESPVNLAGPFPTDASTRARELGLMETQIGALPEIRAAAESIYHYAWDTSPAAPGMEREGVVRTQKLAESQLPAEIATEEFKVLAGQFIQQIFINSGGARYLPRVSAETALIEDFAENEAADAPSKLLGALRLPDRRGLARADIEKALIRSGGQILADQLKLDPLEFRLVCIPYDLYMRLGRDRGWGHWPHWTHFDGYQVMAGNRLGALVGGDGRFGGIADLVSISRTDSREGVYARFAVVRRARMVARWR